MANKTMVENERKR